MNCPNDGKRCYIKQEGGLPSKCRHHPIDLFLRNTFCAEGIAYYNKILSQEQTEVKK